MRKTIIFMAILCSGVCNAQKSKKIEDGNNQFAFELYHQIGKESKNLFFSPYSISTALAMTYSGAGGATATEMGKVMGFLTDQTKNDEAFKSLIEKINSRNNNDLKIKIANRLFGEQTFKFNESFLDRIEENYGAPLEKVNFKDKEASRKKINTWVEDQTNQKIKELIKKNVLPDSTKLVLVNAIYFYGDWANQFDSSFTQKKKFFVTSEKSIEHKMMYQKTYFSYMQNESFQAIRMPYKNNQIYMEVYLPLQKNGIEDLEKKLNYTNYKEWENSFGTQEVMVTFPKYKMTCDFSLGDQLQEMGMKTAFSDEADFFEMVQKKNDGLKISKVIHKAFIDVSEKGTEAAAATAVIMVRIESTSYHEREMPKVFNADHPFIFMIKDRETGSILFMGKVMNPAE